MKLTPVQALKLVNAELDKGNGIYIDSRYFSARVNNGVLQVSDSPRHRPSDRWFTVQPGAKFRSYWNTDLFTYEPCTDYKRLVVEHCPDMNRDDWAEAFASGSVMEVVRETAQYFMVAPLGFELKVSKKRLELSMFKPGKGPQLRVAEPLPTLADIIRANVERFDNSKLSVEVSTAQETVAIECPQTEQDLFMQGSDAAEFIAQAEALEAMPECETFARDDIYKHLAMPYAENVFN